VIVALVVPALFSTRAIVAGPFSVRLRTSATTVTANVAVRPSAVARTVVWPRLSLVRLVVFPVVLLRRTMLGSSTLQVTGLWSAAPFEERGVAVRLRL
jgi:hypothetical protein